VQDKRTAAVQLQLYMLYKTRCISIVSAIHKVQINTVSVQYVRVINVPCKAAADSIRTWDSFILPSEHKAVIMVLLCVISPQLWERTTVIKDRHSQRNKVSTESIEVNIFRVIYGSF